MPRGSTPEQRRAKNIAGAKWDKENTKQVRFKLNIRTDADILSHLEKQENVQGYVKHLIREDISSSTAQATAPGASGDKIE